MSNVVDWILIVFTVIALGISMNSQRRHMEKKERRDRNERG